VKRGNRIVHGDKELIEKLGRNDPCPCGSGRSFQELLPKVRQISMEASATTLAGEVYGAASVAPNVLRGLPPKMTLLLL